MKTDGSSNACFSYEEKEPIGPKLVYLNKNASSIARRKPNVSNKDVIEDQLHELFEHDDTFYVYLFV